MADLNKVFLMGRLTFDPELRYTPSGAAVTDLRLATSRQYKTKDGESREDKLFIDVTVWNRQAENCCQYLKKGRAIHVEGYLKMESWDDKATGEKRSKIKVEADRVQFLDGPRDAPSGVGPEDDYAPPASGGGNTRRGPSGPGSNGSGAPRTNYPPASGAPRRPAAPPSDAGEGDDDIPF